jgi:perosamine synthetase
MSFIAPAGTPLRIADLAAGIGAGLFTPRAGNDLRQLLTRHSGQSRCWTVASGRAAMTVVMRAMKAAGDPARNEVIVPGYTCYSVPAAIERAGLKVRLCDVDARTLSLDLDQLRGMNSGRVLAVVSANLYGIPNDLAAIEALAAERGVFMLDDAAQALGARCAGRAVGGFGDAGLYSFDKGKNITTMQGGAIVARAGSLAGAIDKEQCALPAAAPLETLSHTMKLVLYGALLRPALYGLVQRIPGLGLGRTIYETPTPMRQYSSSLAGLALRLARRLDAINAVRVGNAASIASALATASGIRLPVVSPDAQPVFARFPVFVNDASRRAELVRALNAAGIGATTSYPEALVNVPQVAPLLAGESTQHGAMQVARTVVTLPTHGYSPADLGQRVRAIVDATLGK